MCQVDDRNIESINRDLITLYTGGQGELFPETLEGLLPHLKCVKTG